jgi:D-glycero-alpha-D-manno-heptose-7-phosphate kinase
MRADPRAIEAVAPLRISFVGGGTDFPHWYENHDGAVLSSTIDHAVRVRIAPRGDRQVTVRSLDLGHLVEYHLDEGPVYDGVMDLAKAAIDRVGAPDGVDVEIRSEAPPGSGLGGSSALVTAMVAGLAMLRGRRLGAHELARLAYAIERDDVGISGGWQDQYAAAFGGFNLLQFSHLGVRVTPVRLRSEDVQTLRRTLLLCYTGGVRRNVGLIDRQIELHRQGREETLLGTKQLTEMAYAMRDALEAGRVEDLGPMLHDAFEAKKRMNPHIAEGTAIESMLDAARSAGASGGKICGAGGGGYLLVSCAPDARAGVARALETLGGQIAPFAFRAEGVRARRGSEIWAPDG